MLISCKCMNFIANINNHRPEWTSKSYEANISMISSEVETVDENNVSTDFVNCNQSSNIMPNDGSDNSNVDDHNSISTLVKALKLTYVKRYPRNFIFYSQYLDFFKQAIGPITDLSITTISQRELIYSITIQLIYNECPQMWQLSVCGNCNVALCGKLLRVSCPTDAGCIQLPQYIINSALLTNNEELIQKRSDKAFSDTFGILIMDHSHLGDVQNSFNISANTNFTMLPTNLAFNGNLDPKQLRLKQLQTHLQQRLQHEIAETDRRIRRFTEQQFALLRSFREKSEQEHEILVHLINCITEQGTGSLDCTPAMLDISGIGPNMHNYGCRRRNTISSKKDLNAVSYTPNSYQSLYNAMDIVSVASMTNNDESITNSIQSNAVILNRKLANFDTPPTTPEATPMSVGNSPTFRTQRQQGIPQQSQQQQNDISFRIHNIQKEYDTTMSETGHYCLFDLEGIDENTIVYNNSNTSNINHITESTPNHLTTHSITNPKELYIQQQQNTQQETKKFGVDDSGDSPEEAEDALHLESLIHTSQINENKPRHVIRNIQSSDFAKSLPIEIAVSPKVVSNRNYVDTDIELENEMDNLDIAASIKALAESLHGEAVFGDLPRPRICSQI